MGYNLFEDQCSMTSLPLVRRVLFASSLLLLLLFLGKFRMDSFSNMSASGSPAPAVLSSEFIFDKVPFEACHASTIAEARGSLVAAWFGGTHEGHPDVGIWLSRKEGGSWSAPLEIATGIQFDGRRNPCWNPVLFTAPDERLYLFYKVGPSPDEWWGMMLVSEDSGKSWMPPVRLPTGILGPIKNKPILLKSQRLLCPSSTERDGWKIHLEYTDDWGKSWHATSSLNDGRQYGAIQPALLFHPHDSLQLLCRSRQGKILQSWSADNGLHWTPLAPASLPNPNSGIDAVTLRDGRQLLVYNHAAPPLGKGGGPRTPLNVAVSPDGEEWKAALILENQAGEYSYPAVIQTQDGRVQITYTWNRKRIKHIVLDPAHLQLQAMSAGKWPISR